MLSASTARLVDQVAALESPELVQVKGADEPVLAYRLMGMADQHRAATRVESSLVGRRWEMAAVEGVLERAIDGHGTVVGVVGPPGIGKSRLVRDVAVIAARRGVDVFVAFCESHTTQVPFHVITRLFRSATGVDRLDPPAARGGAARGGAARGVAARGGAARSLRRGGGWQWRGDRDVGATWHAHLHAAGNRHLQRDEYVRAVELADEMGLRRLDRRSVASGFVLAT